MAKINYITGDLLASNEKLIAHGCNVHGVMGAGIALAIRNKWPEVYKQYNLLYKEIKAQGYEFPLGFVQFVKLDNGLIVANAMTQYLSPSEDCQYFPLVNKTKPVSYDAIQCCAEALSNYCKDNNIESFGIPKIGAGLGGGKWEIIEAIFSTTVDNSVDVNVYVL